MWIESNIRHRPQLTEQIEERHQKVMSALHKIDELWGSKDQRLIPKLDSDELSGVTPLDDVLSDSFGGAVYYRKAGMPDEAMYDDILIFRYNDERVNHQHFATNIFPKLVQAFGAYRARIILDVELSLDDHDKIVELHLETGKEVDGRGSVYRINSVNYFDRELCRRAFSLPPEEIVERLNGKIEQVEILNDGVLLIVTSEFLNRPDIERIDSQIRSILQSEK